MTRDEVIKALERELEVVDRLDMDWEAGLLRAALNVLKAEPKRGRWMFKGATVGYMCSECGEYVQNESYAYCPNCGARNTEE